MCQWEWQHGSGHTQIVYHYYHVYIMHGSEENFEGLIALYKIGKGYFQLYRYMYMCLQDYWYVNVKRQTLYTPCFSRRLSNLV